MSGERATDGRGPIVDLNADVGEAADEAGIAVERELLRSVTSVHVACGGHAGDAASMQATVSAALAAGVRVGAHPSYPDRDGFGRRPLDLAPDELASSLRAQIGDLLAVARACGTTVYSVKAHGALYADVAAGGAGFGALVGAVKAVCAPGTALVVRAGSPSVAARPGPPASRCWRKGSATGLTGRTASWCRARWRVRSTTIRMLPCAKPSALARHGTGRGLADGAPLRVHIDTLCLHGDSPNAAEHGGAGGARRASRETASR